jgi:hypothetical protein
MFLIINDILGKNLICLLGVFIFCILFYTECLKIIKSTKVNFKYKLLFHSRQNSKRWRDKNHFIIAEISGDIAFHIFYA